MEHTKIAIIGAGNVGSTTAYALMLKNIVAEIILVDIDTQRCEGEVIDLSDALSFCKTSLIRTGSAQDAGQADIIIIAAGMHQKPGQSRGELIKTNKPIIASIIQSMQPISPNSIIIMVTNPLDTLTLYAQQLAELPRNQIFGSGTLLDSQRLRGIIAEKYNIAAQSVDAYMLGEHGDSQFAAWSTAHIDGIQLTDLPNSSPPELEKIELQVRKKAYEIIAYKGATYFGIATCVAEICTAIIFDQKLIMPLSCYLKDFDVCLSMPVVLGEKGIEKKAEINLSKTEQEKLAQSAQQLQKLKTKYLDN